MPEGGSGYKGIIEKVSPALGTFNGKREVSRAISLSLLRHMKKKKTGFVK